MADQQPDKAPAFNYLNLVGQPDDIIELAKAQARQQLAAQLLQQGTQPIQPFQMAGNVAIKASPLQGLASMLSTGAGAAGIMKGAQDIGQIQQSRYQSGMGVYDPNNPSAGPKAGQGPFTGMTPAQMLYTEMSVPGKLEQMQHDWNMAKNKPTETTLTASQAGLSPAEQEQANLQQLLKNNSNLEFTRDGKVIDKYSGKVVAVYPRLAEGATYALQNPSSPLGPNNQPIGMTAYPGAPQAYQNAAFAGASGTAGGGIGQYTYGGRENVPMYGVNAAGGLPQIPNIPDMFPGQPQGQPPGPLSSRPVPSIPHAAAQPRPQFGMSPADRAIQNAGGANIAELPRVQTTLAASRQQLESALNAVRNLPASGPGSDVGSKWVAIASSLTGGQVAADPVKAYQTVTDYLSNASAMTSKVNGISNVNLAAVGKGPQDMNVPALQEAIRNALAGADAGVVGAKYQLDQYNQLNGKDPQAPLTAQRNWANVYDPNVFAFHRMSPEEKSNFKTQLSKDPAAFNAFKQKYNAANQAGWVQ